MKFSVATPLQRIVDGRYEYDFDAFLAEAQAAERAGFDTVVVGERRIGPTAYTTSPHILAAAALSHTTRIRLGIYVVVLPLRHPIEVAQDAAVLNSLFPGRYRLGVGAGYNEHAFEMLGVDLEERGRLMEEGLQTIDAFRRGRIEIDVGRGPVPALDPAMGPHVPEVLVGAWAKGGIRRAARYGDGWLVDPMRTISVVEEMAGLYREECERHGVEPYIVLLREAWLGETDEEAAEEYGPAVVQAHGEYFPRMKGGWKSRDDAEGKPYDVTQDSWLGQLDSKEELALEHLLEDRLLVGSPETWRTRLKEWQTRVQPDEVVLRLRFQGGPSPHRTLKVIDRIGREIIPHFQDA